MNILYIHQHFSTPKGSVGTRSYEMASSLIANGHNVTIVCGSYKGGVTGIEKPFLKGKRVGKIRGIKVIELDLSYSNNDNFIKRSITFIKFALYSIFIVFKEKYDVLFATSTPLTVGIPGIIARWVRKKKFIFEVRDLWPELPKSMGVITNPLSLHLLSILEWACYHSAHHCIALSPGIAEGIAKRGITKQKITLIPNGCDLRIFDSKEKYWRPKGVKKNDFTTIFAGTHGIANGLDAIIDVATELKKRKRDDIKFLLIGDGSQKIRLFTKAQENKLNNVFFLDPMDKEKLALLIKSCNLGLQILKNIPAFYYGTSPNKFFDYIAAGVPVLCNYPGWLAKIIVSNKCGFVVEPNDPILFANILETAAKDRQKLKKMGSNALSLARKEFDRTKLGYSLTKILERKIN